jgi:hypothetical protein
MTFSFPMIVELRSLFKHYTKCLQERNLSILCRIRRGNNFIHTHTHTPIHEHLKWLAHELKAHLAHVICSESTHHTH